MDMARHMDLYYKSLVEDSFEGFAAFVDAQTFGSDTARELAKSAAHGACKAIDAKDEKGYWEWLGQHQAICLELHRRFTIDLLDKNPLDSTNVFDFIQEHGWRRFRFSGRILHMEMKIGGEDWLVSIVANYLPDTLEKLRAFGGISERHVAIDALEMERLLLYGNPRSIQLVLQEKLEGFADSRHIVTGEEHNPNFVKISLKNTNSSLHVSDWILPLRSQYGDGKRL